MASDGHAIALMVGPPGKMPKGKPSMGGEGSDDEEAGESGGEEEAEVNAMAEFQDKLKNGSPEEALKAWEQFRDICG